MTDSEKQLVCALANCIQATAQWLDPLDMGTVDTARRRSEWVLLLSKDELAAAGWTRKEEGR